MEQGEPNFLAISQFAQETFVPFVLPPLPFAMGAFGGYMSAETLAFHHGKHHQAYVDKANALLARRSRLGSTLVEVIRGSRDCDELPLFNNSAQLWNHSFFWQCLAPPKGQSPGPALAKKIQDEFGSTESMLAELQAEASNHFSNGWAWLVLDRGKLRILSLHDADTPVIRESMQPLFTLDAWEHAYYLDYRNDRAAYAAKLLGNLVNWEFVEANLDGRGLERADQRY